MDSFPASLVLKERDLVVGLTGLKSVPANQAWFWADDWQTGEHEASRQSARGEGTVYDSAEDFLDSLR